jgi:ubiquinone/menaquinone biosynthesis C-methylase UbiE
VDLDGARPYASGAAWFYAEHRPRPCREFVDCLVKRLQLSLDDRVLDLGGGVGTTALALAPLVGQVVLVDSQPELLSEAARRAECAGIRNVRFVEAEPQELPKLGLAGGFSLATVALTHHWLSVQEDVFACLDVLLDARGAVAVLEADSRDVLAQQGHETQLHHWRGRLVELLDQFAPQAQALRGPYDLRPAVLELLQRSPFGECERLCLDYDVVQQPSLETAIGLLYSDAWVLQRLAHKRTLFERVAREELGWVDRLPPIVERRMDVALVGFRPLPASAH